MCRLACHLTIATDPNKKYDWSDCELYMNGLGIHLEDKQEEDTEPGKLMLKASSRHTKVIEHLQGPQIQATT